MATIHDKLKDKHLLEKIALDAATTKLLSAANALEPTTERPDGEQGELNFAVGNQLFGFFDFNLKPPGPDRKYVLTFEGPLDNPTAFRVAISLNEGPQSPLFEAVAQLPGHVLIGAEPGPDGGLVPKANPDVTLKGGDVVLVVKGKAGETATTRLSTRMEPPDDMVILELAPPDVLLGDTGFGLTLPAGLVLDSSADAAAPGETRIDGELIDTIADQPGWQGIVARSAKLWLPKNIPFIDDLAVEAYVAIGSSPTPGADVVILAKVPPDGDRPGIAVRIECRDPAASGLAAFVPTLVEATMTLPVDGRQEGFAGQTVTFGAGDPVQVRARWSRQPALPGVAPDMILSIAVEGQGPAGIVSVSSRTGEFGAKVVVTAATLVTALIADGGIGDEPGPDGDGSGVILHTLLTAAVALSSYLDEGGLVLHGVELAGYDDGSLPPEALRLKIDYSVEAKVTPIELGVLSVQMQDKQPLRVRVREALLSFFPDRPGLEKFHLDYTKSSLEIEDPGGWKVNGPGSLFDVLGTRSGRGSLWIEVDLRFKLDLGPVKVSGATIRATLDEHGKLKGELRGLAARLDLAPAIDGEGAVQITADGFYAYLAAHIQPLGNPGGPGALAVVQKKDDMIVVGLGVDLPGPIPIAATGLGLYGIGGVFAINGKPFFAPGDPLRAQLDWDYQKPDAFRSADGSAFGLEAVIGTAPDMGFSFSARSGLFLTLPDVAIRGAVTCKFLSPRATIVHQPPDPAGFNAEGVVVVDPADGVTIAVEGRYRIPRILELIAPVAARFPFSKPDWYIHIGADGWRPAPGGVDEGRGMGPVRATILPDIFPQKADAYLMLRGNGITAWPRGGVNAAKPYNFGSGFMIAFGFGFDLSMGVKPILWAEVFARADILLATQPLSFVGFGKIGGRLHITVFSVGVWADVHLYAVDGQPIALTAAVCGEVDLLFDTIRKCVSISFNEEPTWTVPPPSTNPLQSDDGQALVDDRYNVIGRLATSREAAEAAEATVWADAIPLLSFTTAPAIALSSAQFPNIANDPWGPRAKPVGNDLLEYAWSLSALSLIDDTNAGNPLLVAGPMSSAWLKPKAGQGGGQPQPAELALLTPETGLWLNAFADGGAGLPDEPLKDVAGICQIRPQAAFGWATGALAAREANGWRLPPDPASPDPCQSQVSALARSSFGTPNATDFVLDDISGQALPLPYGYARALVRPMAPQRLNDHDFAGFLQPGCALDLPDASATLFSRTRGRNAIELALQSPIRDGRLWLVVERATWVRDEVDRHVAVRDNLNRRWEFDIEIAMGPSHVALHYRAPAGGWVERVTVQSAPRWRLGIVAIGGVTAAADAAAAAATAAAANVAAGLAAASNAPPPSSGTPQPNLRCVLKPGKIYRIDVAMAWTGTLYRRNDNGVREQKDSASDTVVTSFWFRTAPAGLPPAVAAPQTLLAFEYLHRKRNIFDPAMLARHLRGHEPAQSELNRFADDPVRVHFGVSHVKALASVYRFDLKCNVRRLDVPDTAEDDQLIDPFLIHPVSSQFLQGAEKAIANAYLASPCLQPPPGVVMQATPQLSVRAWYEVHVLAKAMDNGVANGRLDGVTFQTSRWRNAPEMLAALRFPETAQGRHSGDIWLRGDAALPEGVILDDDTAFDRALDDLGLEGWPTATEPRVSLLWQGWSIAGWRCAGVMLESPEPIHRPGRFHVAGMQVRTGSARRNLRLGAVRRDRSGSRMIFATPQPFVPTLARGPLFQIVNRYPVALLDCEDFALYGLPPIARTGSLRLPLTPAFAGETR